MAVELLCEPGGWGVCRKKKLGETLRFWEGGREATQYVA